MCNVLVTSKTYQVYIYIYISIRFMVFFMFDRNGYFVQEPGVVLVSSLLTLNIFHTLFEHVNADWVSPLKFLFYVINIRIN